MCGSYRDSFKLTSSFFTFLESGPPLGELILLPSLTLLAWEAEPGLLAADEALSRGDRDVRC